MNFFSSYRRRFTLKKYPIPVVGSKSERSKATVAAEGVYFFLVNISYENRSGKLCR